MKGGITLWQLTYADDSALLCRTATEASQRVSAVRMGFRCDGDKEVSQPKTEAMRMKKVYFAEQLILKIHILISIKR